jgi:hypothetical protein
MANALCAISAFKTKISVTSAVRCFNLAGTVVLMSTPHSSLAGCRQLRRFMRSTKQADIEADLIEANLRSAQHECECEPELPLEREEFHERPKRLAFTQWGSLAGIFLPGAQESLAADVVDDEHSLASIH